MRKLRNRVKLFIFDTYKVRILEVNIASLIRLHDT